MISPVALSVYVSSAVAAKIEMIARSGFKAVQMLVVGYPEFRSRYLATLENAEPWALRQVVQ